MHYKVRNRFLSLSASILVIAGAVACSKDKGPEPRDPSNYGSQFSAELAEERQEFINDTEERLSELDNEIARLKARIQGESQYVSESDRAEWNQDLFELQQDRERAQAELQRARTASAEEWQQMRSNIGIQVDRLESGVRALGSAIGGVFSGGEQEPVRGEDEQQRLQQEQQREQQELQQEHQQEQQEQRGY